MSTSAPQIAPTVDLSDLELLSRLGLGAGASDAQVEEAHDELVSYLERAPASLRGWARSRIAEADEAYAILSGELPEAPGERGASVAPDAGARGARTARSTGSRHHGLTRGESEATGDWLGGDPLEGDGAGAAVHGRSATAIPPTKRGTRGRPRHADYEQPVVSGRFGAIAANPTFRRLGLAAAAIAALVIVGFAGYQLGNPGLPAINGTPNPSSSAGGLDLAAVSADMQKIAANPKDVTALQDLADLYYASGDYQTAGTWIAKILEVDSANVSALLGKGAVAFNLGDLTAAEAAWRQVLVVDSKNLEAHYDLGFMYLKQDPPDTAKARSEWQQVIDIAPDSDVAKTIQTHLQSLGAASSPSASPGASGVSAAPSPSASGS